MLVEADTNGDGQIDLSEFIVVMKRSNWIRSRLQ